MFSHPRSLLLVLLILRSDTNGNNDFMTRFCLSTDPQSQTEKGPTTEECCVHFSFTLPSSKPSTSHEDPRQDCPERIVLTKTISSHCEDHDTEWLQSVGKAYDWCYVPKQDSSKTFPLSINQFLDAKTTEDCCYLFSQSPAQVFTPREEKTPNVCEQISFNLTLPASTRDCRRHRIRLARDFIRQTYNCLKWAY
ncbi:uncharacterized protein LOC113524014 isoform X1 [Tachysurus ichikawai]